MLSKEQIKRNSDKENNIILFIYKKINLRAQDGNENITIKLVDFWEPLLLMQRVWRECCAVGIHCRY